MAFPSTPTNGQIAVVGGIAYQYATTPNSWSRILSSANIITANAISVNTLTANTLNVNNSISATGNITGNYILGNGSQLTGITGSGGTSIANGTSNITIASSGGNATVNIGGTADVAVFAVTGEYVTGVVSASGNVTGGNLLTGGLISATGALSVTGATTLTTVSTGNISAGNVYSGGSITTGSLISAVGNVTGGNVVTGGLISATGNVSSGAAINTVNLSVSGNVLGNLLPSANITYDLGSPTQMWRTIYVSGNTIVLGAANLSVSNGDLSVGGNPVVTVSPTGTSNATGNMNVIGNITGSNITTAGLISAVGNVTGNYFVGNGSLLTGIASSGGGGITWTTVANTAPSNAAPGDFWYNSYTDIKYQYTNDGTGNFWIDQSYPTSFSTLAVTGNITSGNVATTGNITSGNVATTGILTVNSGAAATAIVNGAGNAVGNIGSSGTYFNRLFAQATTALYADLAEVYKSDAEYPPGTVLVFGGSQEVTISTQSHDARIAGVVSTNPAHVMNSGLVSEYTVDVGLIGRVPCQVIGPIAAGDRVVSSNRAGVAERLNMLHYQPGVIIGKAVESYNGTDVGTIEIVVGRL
jgi:hypothetical protein